MVIPLPKKLHSFIRVWIRSLWSSKYTKLEFLSYIKKKNEEYSKIFSPDYSNASLAKYIEFITRKKRKFGVFPLTNWTIFIRFWELTKWNKSRLCITLVIQEKEQKKKSITLVVFSLFCRMEICVTPWHIAYIKKALVFSSQDQPTSTVHWRGHGHDTS